MEPLKLAASFGIEVTKAVRSPHSNLSSVFILDDRYVLRSRMYTSDIDVRIKRERELLGVLRAEVGVKAPMLLPSVEGKLYVPDGERIWTLYERIPGEILCNWTELYKMRDSQWAVVFSFLRDIHDTTRGKVPIAGYSYVREVRRGMELIIARIAHS